VQHEQRKQSRWYRPVSLPDESLRLRPSIGRAQPRHMCLTEVLPLLLELLLGTLGREEASDIFRVCDCPNGYLAGDEFTLDGVDVMLFWYMSNSFRAYLGVGAGWKRGAGGAPSGIASGNIFGLGRFGSDSGVLKDGWLLPKPNDRTGVFWMAGSTVLKAGA
jgi:hypothetical protein